MELREKNIYPVNRIRICFDKYSDVTCEGRIYSKAMKEEILFSDVKDLIVQIDNVFNKIGQPQPSQVLRSFGQTERYQPYKGKPILYRTDGEIAEQIGAEHTIDMTMTSRVKAEWQGYLKEPDSAFKGRFDTVLECIDILTRRDKKLR